MKQFLAILLACATLAACRFAPDGGSSSVSLATRQTAQQLELPEHADTEDVISYSGFTVSYNHETLIPNWVAYELTSDELEPVYTSQSSTFSMDRNVAGRQAMREDYANSGWDKGHMAPKADMRWSETAYWESHYFTNVCPQNHELNSGDWNTLEKRVRAWARQHGRIYVVCGPVVGQGVHGTIGQRHVCVPDAFFKAVLIPEGDGFLSAAFVMPNSGRHHKLSDYVCTVDELEAQIQRNLFVALDKMGLEEVERTVSVKL